MNEQKDKAGRTPEDIDREIEALHQQKRDIQAREEQERREEEHCRAVEAGRELSAIVQRYNEVEREQLARLEELHRMVAAQPGARSVTFDRHVLWTNFGPGTTHEQEIRRADALRPLPRNIIGVDIFGVEVICNN